MAFIEHLPSRFLLPDKASVSCRVAHETLTINIKKQLLENLMWSFGEKIRLYYDEDNRNNLLLVKSEDGTGYKLVRPSQNNTTCRFQARKFYLSPEQKNNFNRTRQVDFKVEENKLYLFLNPIKD